MFSRSVGLFSQVFHYIWMTPMTWCPQTCWQSYISSFSRLLDGGGTGASIGMAPQDDPDTLSSDEFCSTVFEEVKRTLLCVGHICDNLQPLTGAVSFPLLILFLFPCLSVSAVRFLAIFLVMATVPIIPLMGHQVPHFVSWHALVGS